MNLRKTLGLDGPVTYTFLARLINIFGSTGTVLLIVHFLNPTEQGYYYTLLSLVSLQIVFEMGFSFVIQQLAAHECIHLEITADGTVNGDAAAHARLASTLQLSLRWYTLAAAAMGLILVPLGMVFFARHAAGTAHVGWLGPWLAAVGGSMLGLWCTPFYSFLEGCGEVRAVAAMRLRQAGVLNVLAWGAMLFHHGLYSPAMVIVGQAAVGLLFLASRRNLLLGLLHPPGSRSRYLLDPRSVAFPVADRNQFDVRLLHNPGFYSHHFRSARSGRCRANGHVDQHNGLYERSRADLDLDENRAIRTR